RLRRRRARAPPRRRGTDRRSDVAARPRPDPARLVPGLQRRVGPRGAARGFASLLEGGRKRQGRRSSPLTAVKRRQLLEQLMFFVEITPSVVGEPKAQLTVSTTVPGGCSTVIVALVNATSVMSSVQLAFGQSGAPGIGVTGASVVTEKGVLPFLISLAGIACVPVNVTGAGFWPGG